jgi:hypothetical protein
MSGSVACRVLATVFPNFKRVLHLNLALLYFADIAFFCQSERALRRDHKNVSRALTYSLIVGVFGGKSRCNWY